MEEARERYENMTPKSHASRAGNCEPGGGGRPGGGGARGSGRGSGRRHQAVRPLQ